MADARFVISCEKAQLPKQRCLSGVAWWEDHTDRPWLDISWISAGDEEPTTEVSSLSTLCGRLFQGVSQWL
jgi:hypothetical protein